MKKEKNKNSQKRGVIIVLEEKHLIKKVIKISSLHNVIYKYSNNKRVSIII